MVLDAQVERWEMRQHVAPESMPSQIFSWNKPAVIHSMQRFIRQLGICLLLANVIAAFCSHKISDGVSKQRRKSQTVKEVPEQHIAGCK